MKLFADLGQRVEQRWNRANYDEREFPQIATDLLERINLVGQVDPVEILRWLGQEPALPAQLDPGSFFSDAAITLYEAPRFFVAAYFWLADTTSVHQHSFSGAFQVLSGSSLHNQYRFHETRRVNGSFRLGTLSRGGVELLPAGSVRTITSGDAFIHSLFHLERPSVTICIRTKSEPGSMPQWSYTSPGVALDPFFQDPSVRKKLEAVRVLLCLGEDRADPRLEELIAGADLQASFQLLQAIFHGLTGDPLRRAFSAQEDSDRFRRLLAKARERHGDVVDGFVCCFEEEQRQIKIVTKRNSVTDPEHRFLLALLLNVSDRKRVLELVQERCVDRDPVDAFVEGIVELARTRELGSLDPNILDVREFDEEHRFVLQQLLRGDGDEDIARGLQRELPTEDAESVRTLASEIVRELRGSSFFRELLAVRSADPPVWGP